MDVDEKVSQDQDTNRITELIYELNDCREDARNNQSQILQVLVTAGTLLGILFSASYFNPFESVENSRVIFVLSIFIIGTAVSYILTLGIESVLRYYYIQNLEDRLHVLIPTANDDREMNHSFLHWSGFSAPIITRNLKHITSRHTLLYFISYTIAVICTVGFSGYLIYILFSRIETKRPIDYILGIVAIIAIAIAFFMFLLTSAQAKKMANLSETVSQSNLKRRHQSRHQRGPIKMYQEASEFGRLILYFLYPKTSDPQKPLLIILGFIGGLIFINRNIPIECFGEYIQTFELKYICPLAWMYISRLVYVLMVFEFLAYQARYQINDIRGINEDRNRLLPKDKIKDEQKAEYIKLSLIFAAAKIILAVIMVVKADSSIRMLLRTCLLLLLISTIAYEWARKKECKWAIYFIVGSGYPLRFFLGMFTADPQMWKYMPHIHLFLMIVAFWAYGSYSSILAWANEVTEKIRYVRSFVMCFPANHAKKHFMSLQEELEERYEDAEERYKVAEEHYQVVTEHYKFAEERYKDAEKYYNNTERDHKIAEKRYKAVVRRYEVAEKRYRDTEKRYKDIGKRCESAKERYKDAEKRYKDVKKRYKDAKKRKMNSKIFPLRERGKFIDSWNIAYIFTVTSLWILKVMYLSDLSIEGIWVLETVSLLCFIATILTKHQWIVVLMFVSWINVIIVGSTVFLCVSTPLWYLFLCLIQIIITATYFILRYSIQTSPPNLSKILGLFIKLIIGNDAWKYFSLYEGN